MSLFQSQENNKQYESDIDHSGSPRKGSNYPLSEVQELLRHHGTEIRLQAVNGNSAKQEQNGSYCHSEVNGNGHAMDYFPLYGVEALLNNHADAGTSFRLLVFHIFHVTAVRLSTVSLVTRITENCDWVLNLQI